MAVLLSTLIFSSILATGFGLPGRSKFAGPPALPLSEVAPGLPSPQSQGLVLKHIGLGLGTQNYSCADGASTPIAVGALARLYDATNYLTVRSSAVDDLAPRYLKAYERLYNVGRCSAWGQISKFEFPCQDLTNLRLDRLPLLGEHFFTSAGVPTFDLNYAGLVLATQKVASVPAPATAYAGKDGEGAVSWLYLTDDGQGDSVGLKAVYRVETAGGSPPASCDGQPDNIYVPYAAEYWFYD